MKRIRYIFFIVMSILIFSAISAHAEKAVYKIGIVNDYDSAENDISSYAISSLNTLFDDTDDAELVFDDYNTNSGIEALGTGASSFLAMVPLDDELSDKIDFTDRPIAAGFLSLFVSNNKDLYFRDYLAFNGMSIAMTPNARFESMLAAFAKENGFTYTPVYCATTDEMKNAVSTGKADALLMPATDAPENMRIIAKCGRFGYYCAVKKGNTSLLNTLNRRLLNLEEENPFYISKLYLSSYNSPYNNMVSLTENEYRAAKDKKKLRVLIPDNYPMAYYNSETESYDGIYVDIINQIMENAHLEVEYIQNNNLSDENALYEEIILGKADAVITVSGSTQGVIEATEPYTTLTFYPIGKKTLSTDEALNIGITKDNSWITKYINDTYPQWTVTMYDSIHASFDAAERGEIDAALISAPELQTKTSLIAHPSLSIRPAFSLDIPVRFGVSRITCSTQLANMFNSVIANAAIDSAELENRMYTLSRTYVPTFHDMLYANRVWVMIIAVIISIILMLLLIRMGYLRKLTYIDTMTHVYNANHFIKTANRIMKKDPSNGYLLASIDAINFKLVNSRFGTIIGDQTLITIAGKVKDHFKDHGIFGRLEGDEFLVLLEDNNKNREILSDFNKVDIRIHDSTNYQVHLKTGVCPIKKYDPNTPLTIYIDRASIAKDDADNSTQNYTRYFTDKMLAKLETENELEVDMLPALSKGEFIAYYQPKYDLKTNKIIGAEALVRWNHKVRGLISPGIFIPLFERNGFINEVDFCVYEQVLRLLKKRIMKGKPIVPVSVNVSRCHLSDEGFIDKLEALVDRYEMPKEYMDMEITESIFSEGDRSANDLVYELKKHGFTVSMDDFGSGYSSLNLLRAMPIDTLKIDKAFIDDIEVSDRSVCIVEEIIAMANRIEIKTICEGIETKGQRDILRNAGCDTAQGYYYSRPITEESFEQLLDEAN